MATKHQIDAFLVKMAPYAQRYAAATQRDTGVVLAQWGLESGWGTSTWAVRGNNLGGVKYVGQKEASGYLVRQSDGAKFAKYASLDRFVDDSIRFMSLNKYGYPAVRNATTPAQEIAAISNSAYDEGHYSGGNPLADVYNKYTRQYSGANVPKSQAGEIRRCHCQECGWLCKGGVPPQRK